MQGTPANILAVGDQAVSCTQSPAVRFIDAENARQI